MGREHSEGSLWYVILATPLTRKKRKEKENTVTNIFPVTIVQHFVKTLDFRGLGNLDF